MGNCEGISEIDNYQYRQIKANQINNRKHNTSFKDFPEYKSNKTINTVNHSLFRWNHNRQRHSYNSIIQMYNRL